MKKVPGRSAGTDQRRKYGLSQTAGIIKEKSRQTERFGGFLLVNPIKTPGYAGGISELQLQAKTSYAIIILSPPRHKKA